MQKDTLQSRKITQSPAEGLLLGDLALEGAELVVHHLPDDVVALLASDHQVGDADIQTWKATGSSLAVETRGRDVVGFSRNKRTPLMSPRTAQHTNLGCALPLYSCWVQTSQPGLILLILY